MDNKPDATDKLPQQLGANTPKPGSGGSQAAREAADVAAVEKQQKIESLRTREDYLQQYDPPKKKSKMRRGAQRFLHFLGWMLLIVILTAGGAGAGWYFWLRKEPKAAPVTSQTPPAASPPPAAAAAPTQVYNSTPFGLQFDYPEGWNVNEGSDNKIIALSPATKLKMASGSTQTGQIVFTIQHKQTSLSDFKDSDALAARESEKIDYKKPSQTQRASTYLSFLDYAATTGKGLDAVYVTGDNGYQKDQYIPQSDIVKSDPLITLTFRKCSDDKCAKPGDVVALSASAWDDTKFATPLRTMLQSIVVN